jgi:hypothetical protein
MARLARILYNKNHWNCPSGSQKAVGFSTDYGYGYEEWLNRSQLCDENYKYGFIQALHGNIPVEPINPIFLYYYLEGQFVIVGKMDKVEQLVDDTRKEAIERIWKPCVELYREEVIRVKGNPNISEHSFGDTALDFRIPKDGTFILLKSDEWIHLNQDYPDLNQFLYDHNYTHLGILYKWPEHYINELISLNNEFESYESNFANTIFANRPTIYLMQDHEDDNAVTIKEDCDSHWNNAWICRRHGNLDFKLPGVPNIKRYMKAEIQDQGHDFDNDHRWEHSHNHETCCMAGSGYEGRMKFGSVEKAVCFLKSYFNVVACDKNTTETQAWVNSLCCECS